MGIDFDPQQPFRLADAKLRGLTRAEILSERYRRIHRGCFVAASSRVDLRTRVAAALTMVPTAYGASHHTAAALHGAVVPDSCDIHLAVPEKVRCELAGIRVHRYRQPPITWNCKGIRVTAAAQTFADLAVTEELIHLVVLGDSLVRRTSATPEDLRGFLDDRTGRGVRLARRAAAYVRSGVDSPQESRVRMLMVLAGLPEPAVDVRFVDAGGALLRRLDLAYKRLKLAVEYDGRQHIERVEQWRGDILRREDFERLGWRFIVLTSPDIWNTPGATLDRITLALTQLGLAVPRRTNDWQAHFPARAG